METTARRRRTKRPITHYWSLVKDMDDSQKLQLITMLAESVKPVVTEPKKAKKLDIDDFFGVWSDEEYMDADELVKHLKDARHFKDRSLFWDKYWNEP